MTNGMQQHTAGTEGAWAPDPWRRFTLRWHDGIHWTSHVSNGTAVVIDPPGIRADRPLPPPPPHARPVAPAVAAARSGHPSAGGAPSATTRTEAARVPAARVRDTIGARPTDRPRSARWTLIASCVVVPLIGFVLADARDRGGETSFAPSTSANPSTTAETVPTPSSTLPVNTTTTSTTTTTVPAAESDPRLVQDCIEYVPFAAYIGDAELAGLWSSLGMDDGRLRAYCEGLGLIELIELSRQRSASEDFMNGGGTTVPTVPVAPTPPRSAPTTTVPRRSPSVPTTTQPSVASASPSPGTTAAPDTTPATTTTLAPEPPPETTTTTSTTTSTTTTTTTTTTTVPEPPVVPANEPPADPPIDPPADPPADPNAPG